MATTTSNCNKAHNECCNGQHVCVSPCRPVQNIKTKVVRAEGTAAIEGGSGDVVITISPNVFYVFGECTSLTLTLAAGEEGVLNEYMFQFTSGTTATTLSLPEEVKFIGDSSVEAGKTYQLSIVNNIAVIGGI